jgi:uncharacterized LabA/DUF88 family protein
MFNKNEKVAVFIDGANFHQSLESENLNIDLDLFLRSLGSACHLVTVRYYTGLSEDRRYQRVRKTVDWMSYHGFVMVTKPVKILSDGNVKANMDIEIAVDIMVMAHRLDHVVLFSGDGDFVYLLKEIQRQGVRVSVVSSASVVADELKRQADAFYNLSTLVGDLKFHNDRAS